VETPQVVGDDDFLLGSTPPGASMAVAHAHGSGGSKKKKGKKQKKASRSSSSNKKSSSSGQQQQRSLSKSDSRVSRKSSLAERDQKAARLKADALRTSEGAGNSSSADDDDINNKDSDFSDGRILIQQQHDSGVGRRHRGGGFVKERKKRGHARSASETSESSLLREREREPALHSLNPPRVSLDAVDLDRQKSPVLRKVKTRSGTELLRMSFDDTHRPGPATREEKRARKKEKQVERQLVESLRLTQDDWTLILSTARCRTFQNSQAILHQGAPSDCIFQVASGRVRMDQLSFDDCADIDDNVEAATPRTLAILAVSDMFGEVAFMNPGAGAPATYTAAADHTAVYSIARAGLDEIFRTNPMLEGKFFKFLSLMLSRRIRQREIEEEISASSSGGHVFLPQF
jgi:CRP-like cAMP-binding protein